MYMRLFNQQVHIQNRKFLYIYQSGNERGRFFFFFLFSFLISFEIHTIMLSTSIKESNFNSTKSKQIQTVLPYGKHLKGLEENVNKKSQEDVRYLVSLFTIVTLHVLIPSH